MKEHFDKHKTKYYMIGTVVVVGGVCLLIGYSAGKTTREVNKTCNVAIGKNASAITTIVNTAGHPGYIISNPLTGDTWPSIKRAADSLDVSPAKIKSMIKAGELLNLGANTGLQTV